MGLLQRLGKGKVKQKIKTTNNNNNNRKKQMTEEKTPNNIIGKKLIDNIEDLTNIYREGIKKSHL